MLNLKKFLEQKAYALRVESLEMTTKAGSGHPSSCLSAAEIVAALFFYEMRYNPRDYAQANNDRFILSKGHAAPLLYAAWKEVGVITHEDLMTYRQIDSALEGHPTLRFPYAEAATGSLGIGLSIGVGEALNAKLDKQEYRTYVLMGDSEIAEGSVWEAVQLAVHYKLDNLIAIVDCNRLGQSTEVLYDHDIKRYANMFEAFGCETFTVDGHNVESLVKILDEAHAQKDRPSVIIAKTFKGRGVPLMEDREGFHGKPLSPDELIIALAQLKAEYPEAAQTKHQGAWEPKAPAPSKAKSYSCKPHAISLAQSTYKKDEQIATRKAYGQALAALGDVCDTVVSLDAEVKNSTYADIFEAKHPERFFQCYIAEQNMVGMAVGFDRRGKIPFVSTFGSFFSRAHDQIRMAAIGQAKLRLVGSHCGVSIGQDGPSQMALEDIGMMRALPESVVLYPSDAVTTRGLVEQMARYEKGISYLRTTRAETPILYPNNESFEIGGCKILKQSNQDKVCVVAAGITVHEALKAYDRLALTERSIFISIIDLYSVKPFARETVIKVAAKSWNKILIVEDHYAAGGIGEMIAASLCDTEIMVKSLAVRELPRSGKPEELLARAGIDADAIVHAVHDMV
jgi:transketolase